MSRGSRAGVLIDSWRSADKIDQHTSSSGKGQSLVSRGSRAGGLIDSWRSADKIDQHTSSSDHGQSLVSRGSSDCVPRGVICLMPTH